MGNDLTPQKNVLDELYSSIKEYLDMRLTEGKLSLTEGLSIIFSRVIVFVLISLAGAIACEFLAMSLSRWLGGVLHSELLGTLITGGIFVIVAVVLFIFRKRLFNDSMVRFFVSVLFKDKKDESSK